MSVFMKNDCQYSNCGKVFQTLHQLIIHIENDHIDFSPSKIEQTETEKPKSLPLSYVLKYNNGSEPTTVATIEEKQLNLSNQSVIENSIAATTCTRSFDYKKFLFNDNVIRNTPKPPKEKNFLNQKPYILDNGHKKPFICPILGCCKRYKNLNGVKYHCKNFHRFVDNVADNCNKKFKPLKKNSLNRRNISVINLPSSPNICAHIHNISNSRAIAAVVPNMSLYGDRFYNFTATSNELNVPNQVPLTNLNFNNNNKFYGIESINNGYESCSNISSNYLPNNCYQ